METTIKLILQELVRRIWIIILCAIIGLGAMFYYTKYQVAPIYQSTMKMSTMIPDKNDESSVGTYINLITLAERRVATYIELVKTTDFYEQVAEASGTEYSAGAVMSMLYFQQVEDMGIFTVSITGGDPQAVYLVGQAVAQVMPEYIKGLLGESSMLTVLEPAAKPYYPINDTLKSNTIKGGLIGALLSIAVIAVIAFFDTHIKDEESLSKRYPDIPILGTIPDFKNLVSKK